MLAHTPVVITKMETRKMRERNETLVEEVPPPKEKLNKKRPKKVATPRKSTLARGAENSPQHGERNEKGLAPSRSSWKDPSLDHQKSHQCKPISPA